MALTNYVDQVGPPISAAWLNQLDYIRNAMSANIYGALQIGAPTGGFLGPGTLNIAGNLYLNGTPVTATGTVTSVGLASSDFTVSGSPVTISGNITANLATQGSVTPGSYTNVSLTVNSKGIITNVSNGTSNSSAGSTGVVQTSNGSGAFAASSMVYGTGFQVGAPTGGDKGPGDHQRRIEPLCEWRGGPHGGRCRGLSSRNIHRRSRGCAFCNPYKYLHTIDTECRYIQPCDVLSDYVLRHWWRLRHGYCSRIGVGHWCWVEWSVSATSAGRVV